MRPRKSLGQHFLSDPGILSSIAAASGAGSNDVVLEIGPGPGGLTRALLDTGATVVAIERDPRMAARLNRDFGERDFALVSGDALELDWHQLASPWTAAGSKLRIVGNIPYNITTPLLDHALLPPLPASVTFLVQREVADRLMATVGSSDWGALSVGIQAVANVSVPLRVGRAAFSPAPKVDSALVHLTPHPQAMVQSDEILPLRRLTVDLFSYRRKRMHRALREARGVTPELATELLEAAGIDPDLRPEAIAVEGFVRLRREVANRIGS